MAGHDNSWVPDGRTRFLGAIEKGIKADKIDKAASCLPDGMMISSAWIYKIRAIPASHPRVGTSVFKS
jgi:hypothetical protein